MSKDRIVYDYISTRDTIGRGTSETLDYVYSISYPKPEKSFMEMCKDIHQKAIEEGREHDENFRIHYGKYLWPCDFFYIPQKVLDEVWKNRAEAWGATDFWRDHLGTLLDFLFKEPGFKDVYSPTKWSNGEDVRHCENMPLLSDVIPAEAAEKVKEFIESYRNTYRFDSQKVNTFAWSFLSTPTSNRENVIAAWKELGVSVEIPDDSYWMDKYQAEDEDWEAEENDTNDSSDEDGTE